MTEEIDRDGPDYPYVLLANIIRERIRSGEYPAGRRIPSMRTAQQTWGVADHTYSRAVRLLAAEGLIETRPGRGSFVLPQAE